jgi:DNA primase catalytic core
VSPLACPKALVLNVLTVGRVGAGTGCKYLTEQVAAGNDDFAELSPAQALAYYSDTRAHGESPGRWLGQGLGTVGLVAGPVAATELENLVGKARHPNFDDLLRAEAIRLLNDLSLSVRERQAALAAAEKSLYLGRAFATYESAADRAERAVADLGDAADEASKDAIRAQVLAEGDRQAVAAYELTFTPVKSVSVLGAIGGEAVWQVVIDAHRAAVDSALVYVQQHAAYSRAGVNGVRQIDTKGLIIAAFEHRMSREQDPNVHTHAIVANRVLCADGKWRTVDGRAVYAASVGARAVYEQALESELTQHLGVRFSVDERHTIREVHGIPLAVIELFSKRRTAITQAMTCAIDGDLTAAGGWRKLARRFTLSTRSNKAGAQSTAEAIARWQRELIAAGYEPGALLAGATRAAQQQQPRPRTDQQILADAVAVLNQTRAVWTRHHAVLAVSRVLPPSPGESFGLHQHRVEQLVGQLLADSVQVTPPDVLSVGPTLVRDSDAQSVFTAHDDVLYAARSTVAAEQRILCTLEDADAPVILAEELAAGVARIPLGEDQDAAVYAALTTGTRISAIVGPAGSGKTYVQRAIAVAWKTRTVDADHPGNRAVLALAPSQIAAGVLADSIGARAENIAKWLHEYRKETKQAADAATRRKSYQPDPAWTLQRGQLVIVDEASMVTTRDLDAILTAVRKADAKLLLVGDDKQLGAIGAGGMFRTIGDRTHAPVLATVRRFRDEHGHLREWECLASLGLRSRELDAVAEYERRGRIHSGPLARMEETSYRAWLTDHLSFEQARQNGEPHASVALLMADTEAAAADLSARARADLVRRGTVEQRGVSLADGNRAGVGDLIVTRLNERRLRAEGGEGFVANRDTWRVTARGRDGSLTVVAVTGEPRELRLPASYVTANVQLAYAGTVHSAQGRTVTTARGLVTETTSAEALYVMMSRGERSNDAYVVTDDPDRERHQRWPAQHHLSVLAGILEREDYPAASVADVERDLYDQTTSLARLRIIFGDLSTVVRGGAYEAIIAEHAGSEAAERAVTDPAWATLVRALGTAQLLGWDSRHLLIQAVTQRELGTAADVAAVLHWRCESITGHWREAPEAATTGALSWRERAERVLEAARRATLAAPVSADAGDALRQLADAMDSRVGELAERYAQQAADGQQGGYENGSTPTWLTALGPVPTSGRDVEARRELWLRHAGAVATYHDVSGYEPSHTDPIGPRPSAGDAEACELWNAARAALADAPIAATMRAMLPDRLHAWVAEALYTETREQPAYVGHDLRNLSLRGRAQRSRVNRLRLELTAATGKLATADRRRRRRDEAAIASLHRTYDAIAGQLERSQTTLHEIEGDLWAVIEMHQAWQEWEQQTREVRDRGRLAAQELSLRGIEPAGVSSSALPDTLVPGVSPAQLEEQYVIQSAAADWFHAHLGQRWAAAYLAQRGLADPAAGALAGYAPSRPGQWTLLLDHLRSLGYKDTAIETAGLASRSRRGGLIDRFRDRVVFPILDTQDRPIGFIGRKPAADTNPDNPKYLNPPRTPLYDKSHVLLGLDSAAVRRLHDGARPIIVEGAMDRLAISLAVDDLVPLAPSGVALTTAHLDLLAEHTSLDRIILAFDPDPAGRAAAIKAGRMLIDRGVTPAAVEIFNGPPGADPADILATHGAAALADTLRDPQHRETVLDLLVNQLLDRYDTDTRSVCELPIHEHAAYEAARLVADHYRDHMTDPAVMPTHIQRHIARIANRTGTDAAALNSYLIDMLIPTDEVDVMTQPDHPADVDAASHDAFAADYDRDYDPDHDVSAEPAD